MAGTQPARGTRDFLPDDVRRREYVVGIVREVYERYGFEPLETPAFENIETLLGKYGDEGNQLIFKILKRGEQEGSGLADLALRYDLTVPLARVVAQYQNDLPRFFKRYQIQPVWRADRPARGRFREFYQCDIDSIGSTSPVREAEQLSAVSEVLERLGFDNFEIRLNHRHILSALLDGASVDRTLHSDALVALDKFDKVGPEGVLKELDQRGISADSANILLGWVEVFYPEKWLKWLQDNQFDEGHAGFKNLRDILDLLEGTSVKPRIRIAPSLARGLSYYTGAIMEIAVPDLAGSLGGGGRYDDLIGMFLGRSVPACGFSLGLERIIVVMTERNMFPASVARRAVDVMVAQLSETHRSDIFAFASELRKGKLRVDIYPEPDKQGREEKQRKYASARQVPFLAFVRDDEWARGLVTIRNLLNRNEEVVAQADAGEFIRRGLEALSRDSLTTIPEPE